MVGIGPSLRACMSLFHGAREANAIRWAVSQLNLYSRSDSTSPLTASAAAATARCADDFALQRRNEGMHQPTVITLRNIAVLPRSLPYYTSQRQRSRLYDQLNSCFIVNVSSRNFEAVMSSWIDNLKIMPVPLDFPRLRLIFHVWQQKV